MWVRSLSSVPELCWSAEEKYVEEKSTRKKDDRQQEEENKWLKRGEFFSPFPREKKNKEEEGGQKNLVSCSEKT